MNLDTMRELFSYICGQNRDFVADGVLLPVDQRCLGLYLGALLTALWLFATGIWRRGLPGRSVFPINVAFLFAAMMGGLHVIDTGPSWRFACGLWTGHVSMLWLSGAAVQFRRLSQPNAPAALPWRAAEKIQGMAFPVALAGIAAVFPRLLPLGWRVWTAAAGLGVVVLAAAIFAAFLAMAYRASQSRRSRIPDVS
jgi:uncharacterized integral membrane protein